MSQQQVDIFADDGQMLRFAELCNALYERELLTLANASTSSAERLKRRLSGLSYHIKRAAEYLLHHNAPLQVDIHNGSWQAKQAANCPGLKDGSEKTREWFQRYAKMGMPVVIYKQELGESALLLDSIDRIDTDNDRVHVNQYGWFYMDGRDADSEKRGPHSEYRLLKPSKSVFTGACCGHCWNHRGRTSPRALSLRELLLSTTVNWKNFR
ncbi:hypothetical protein [Aestuariibacter salexigens]|uniref:hypothetical protein n=1 Tax=Aestuariibacter salexigens TaxID=226010 RepID=UPI001F0AE679|nr:hypothetical protein [Aestuariibacter salexigens]